jgi:hypothetical protein
MLIQVATSALNWLVFFSLAIVPIVSLVLRFRLKSLGVSPILFFGFVVSAVLIVCFYSLPKLMLGTHQILYGYDESLLTVEEIRLVVTLSVFEEYLYLAQAASGIGWPLKALLVSPFYFAYFLGVFFGGLGLRRLLGVWRISSRKNR